MKDKIKPLLDIFRKKSDDTTAEKMAKDDEQRQPGGLELEFLPEYLEILERPPSSVARFFIASIIALGIIVIAWSYLGRIDIIASSPGRLIVDDRSKIIQAPDLGEVSKIWVEDGQTVKKGELLIELNPTSAIAESERLSSQVVSSQLEIARLEALLTDNPIHYFTPPNGVSNERILEAKEHLLADWKNTQVQIAGLENQIKQNKLRLTISGTIEKETQALMKNAKDRLSSRKSLLDKGYASKLEYLELEREIITGQRERAQLQADAEELRSEGIVLQEQLRQLKSNTKKELLDRLTQERIKYTDVSKQLVQANELSRKMNIVAPVDGVVQQLAVHTLGAVVQSAQQLMMIVPEGLDLLAEVNILNKDIGFIREGQDVEVKVDSFPYTKYGTIKGKVMNVSLDSVEDENLGLIYPSRILLAAQTVRSNNDVIALSPGMAISAEIKTGDRRVIDYLLSPLKEYQSESLKER